MLDEIDRNILALLQQHGRMQNATLARKLRISASACLERVRKLERDGYILGYGARLNPEKLDAGLLVFVEIRLSHTSRNVFQQFRQSIVQIPQVQACHLVSGDFDYLIKARVKDMAAYRALLGEKILPLPGVDASRTYVVMEPVKDTLDIAVET